jgi:MFS family permease
MKEILLLQSFFSIAILLFEIPSWYFSDVIWRKKSIIIWSILWFIWMFIYSLSYKFSWFLTAELILWLGASFVSGTDSAILYDTLVELKKEKDYKKIEWIYSSIGSFSEWIASFLWWFLAVISLRFPFYVEMWFYFMAIPIAFTLIEPKIQKYEIQWNHIKEIFKVVKYSLHHNWEIKWLILYSGFISASTLVMTWLIQPYLNFINLPLVYFGIVWWILNLSVWIFSVYAHKFEMIIWRKKSLVSLIFICFSWYLLLSYFNSIWAIIFIFLFYFVRWISKPILKDYVNKIIESKIRATVLSVKNLIWRLIFSIFWPFIWWIADVYTLQTALLTSWTIFFVFWIISLLFLHKNKAL